MTFFLSSLIPSSEADTRATCWTLERLCERCVQRGASERASDKTRTTSSSGSHAASAIPSTRHNTTRHDTARHTVKENLHGIYNTRSFPLMFLNKQRSFSIFNSLLVLVLYQKEEGYVRTYAWTVRGAVRRRGQVTSSELERCRSD